MLFRVVFAGILTLEAAYDLVCNAYLSFRKGKCILYAAKA